MLKIIDFLKIFIINILFFLLLILFIELVFGSWFKVNSWGNTLRSERSKQQSYSIKFDDKTYNFIYKKNSLGFRGEEILPKELDVILIGGSTVNERFTPLELTISGQLNKLFREEGINIEIFNGGVDGQSTVGHIVNFKKWFSKIPEFNPRVIIYYIGINERFYYKFNPNPENFYNENFNTPHDFETMVRNDLRGKVSDYIKNNSFFISKFKILKFKFFKSRVRSNDYSNFTLTYNINSEIEGQFISQLQADNFFDLNQIKSKDHNEYAVSLKERLKYLIKFTKEIGATPIFINQVMYNGQGVEIMYYTNHIIREFFQNNKEVIFIDLAKTIKLHINDFYDEFHTKPSGSKKIAEAVYPNLKFNLIKILQKKFN